MTSADSSNKYAVHNVIATLYIAMMIISIPFNFLFLSAIITKKHLRTPTNILVSNLAFAGLIIASFFMPFKIFELLNPNVGFPFPKSLDICRLRAIVPVACIFCIGLTLVTICVDRYLVITRSMTSSWKISNKKAYFFLPLSWTISFVIYAQYTSYMVLYKWRDLVICIPFYPENEKNDIILGNGTDGKPSFIELSRLTFWIMHACLSFIIPTILLVTLYSRIIYRLWLSQLPIYSSSSTTLTNNVKHRLMRKKKAIKILIACCLVFLVNNIPYFIIFIIIEFRLAAVTNASLAVQIVSIIYTSAIAYNPILYGYCNIKVRRMIFSQLSCSKP
ncbi:Tachykinin-like peptides receptor 99D [Trichoplax sp. H2]|nr:Tachykinin-like peptides receptor 99D [Trichoplax sp. H2]|eukprot:RDD38017.1 Tachykinin-like peptides receptor 99D [Trichoplax sp. H2]